MSFLALHAWLEKFCDCLCLCMHQTVLHYRFVGNNREEMLHGKHPEERTVQTKQHNQNLLIICD